jgi:hypothetical protein
MKSVNNLLDEYNYLTITGPDRTLLLDSLLESILYSPR